MMGLCPPFLSLLFFHSLVLAALLFYDSSQYFFANPSFWRNMFHCALSDLYFTNIMSCLFFLRVDLYVLIVRQNPLLKGAFQPLQGGPNSWVLILRVAAKIFDLSKMLRIFFFFWKCYGKQFLFARFSLANNR